MLVKKLTWREMKRYWPGLVLSGLLVASSIWGYTQYQKATQLNNFVENNYQRSFYELVASVENIDVLVSKGLVSTSPQQNVLLFSDVWRQAFLAQEDLNMLPIDQQLIARTSQFLTQTGDMSYTLAKQITKGIPISDQQRQTLQEIQKDADGLSAELQQLRQAINDKQYAWGSIRQVSSNQMKKSSEDVADIGFQRIDKAMQDLPTLIYDGPFSDHIDQVKPKGVTGDKIAEADAQQIARQFVDLDPNKTYIVKPYGGGNGKIPVYRCLIAQNIENSPDQINVDVTHQGGHVVTFVNSRPLAAPVLTQEQAIEEAKEFMKKNGRSNFMPNFAQMDEGRSTINFSPIQDGAVVYPDMIKVTVALDNGQIIGYEALNYLMNHHQRSLPKPVVTEEQARELVRQRMDVEQVRLAVIPLETLDEVLCYEVKGRTDQDEEFYIYINVVSGDEERILKVIKTDGGALTL